MFIEYTNTYKANTKYKVDVVTLKLYLTCKLILIDALPIICIIWLGNAVKTLTIYDHKNNEMLMRIPVEFF